MSLYRLLPPQEGEPLPLRVEVGGTDLALSPTGWLPPEVMLSARGRWTQASANARLPAAICGTAARLFLTVRAASLRPPTVPQPRVAFWIDQLLVGEVAPTNSAFHVYALELPPPAVSRVCSASTTLSILAGTFVPARDAGGPDSRELGLAVDWLEITSDAVHAKRE